MPDADLLVAGLITDPLGNLTLASDWPDGFPSGFETYFQLWVFDPLGPAGLAASNGLLGVTP